LRTHRAVADETTFEDGFLKRFFHNWMELKLLGR
jgi:hypothetical protein